jgi:2-desacetyl-2-hydroxyethyl bacteriochlorophyllide A dehydrogenase
VQAKAIVCDAQQNFTLRDVDLGPVQPRDVAIRTAYTGISVGTEFALVRNKISWGPYPIVTGYQGVGQIESVGSRVSEFAAGDWVYYRDNRAVRLSDGSAVSPVAGTHCSRALLDVDKTHGIARLPEGVDRAAASLFVMPAVGLFGVDMAGPRMGQFALVYGCGLIGLGVVAACVHRGCNVIAVDVDPRRLALAREFGAEVTIDAKRENVAEAVRRVAPEGADVVFESTGLPECIDPAIALARPYGKFVWQGNYGKAPVSFHFLPPHGKRLTMFFPCDDGLAPCRRAVIRNMRFGALPWARVITHRVAAAEAASFFDRINRNAVDGLIGAVVDWTGVAS